jgi:hypothetical protein
MNIYTDGKMVANKHGARESALLSNIAYWVEKNRKAGVNKFNGKHWTYLSVDNMKNITPYYSERMIRSTLASLERQGLILKGHFSLKNNTCFYTLTDKAETLFTNKTFHAESGKDGELDLQNELEAPKEKDMQLGKKGNGGGVPADGGAGGALRYGDGIPGNGQNGVPADGGGVGSVTPEVLDTFDDTLTAAEKPLYSVGVDPLLTPKPAEKPDPAAASELTAAQ